MPQITIHKQIVITEDPKIINSDVPNEIVKSDLWGSEGIFVVGNWRGDNDGTSVVGRSEGDEDDDRDEAVGPLEGANDADTVGMTGAIVGIEVVGSSEGTEVGNEVGDTVAMTGANVGWVVGAGLIQIA